jgi:hypothetical protein
MPKYTSGCCPGTVDTEYGVEVNPWMLNYRSILILQLSARICKKNLLNPGGILLILPRMSLS